jgi:uncharacterized protein (TIGR03663 family)
MNRTIVIVCWICVAVTAVFLRFDALGKRPFHADEATGARITARRMEAGGSQFDPKHYHGPLLADLAIPLCKLRGETGWRDMTQTTLRILPAIAGLLLVLLPLCWRRRCGDVPMLAAAAFLATSPLLAYYSRMFIHESLLVLFGMAALMSLTGKWRWGIPGILIGLMFAAKESFAISLIAWSGAAALIAWENRKSLDRAALAAAWREHRIPVIVSGLASVVTAIGFYTDGFRHLQGAVDAVRTFFVYETVEGHDKSFGYYFQLLAMPQKSGGIWWFGTPLLVLALIALASTFRGDEDAPKCRATIRFIAYAAAGHFLIYSLIAYKTPWLACLPWAHVCLLAGFAVARFSSQRLATQVALVVLTIICLFTQFRQARYANGRFASDDRNPYAYVPTRRDVEVMEEWLEKLRDRSPAGMVDGVAVIGSYYWPLPWYLRGFEKIGYWKEPPPDLEKFPLVCAMPESLGAVTERLGDTHVSVQRGLRAGVPLYLFVRKDVWQHWLESESP